MSLHVYLPCLRAAGHAVRKDVMDDMVSYLLPQREHLEATLE